jgi:hypothetical protein
MQVQALVPVLRITLMRIRIALFTVMRIRGPDPSYHFDVDPDPTFLCELPQLLNFDFDADPDPDPALYLSGFSL